MVFYFNYYLFIFIYIVYTLIGNLPIISYYSVNYTSNDSYKLQCFYARFCNNKSKFLKLKNN